MKIIFFHFWVNSWQRKPLLTLKTENRNVFFNTSMKNQTWLNKTNLVIQLLFFPIKKKSLKNRLLYANCNSGQIPLLIIHDVFPITFLTPVIPILNGIQDHAVNVQLATFLSLLTFRDFFFARGFSNVINPLHSGKIWAKLCTDLHTAEHAVRWYRSGYTR